MKVSHNWLKQHVDFNWSLQDLTEQLTFPGLPVFAKQRILPT
jgi:hypothetical protein